MRALLAVSFLTLFMVGCAKTAHPENIQTTSKSDKPKMVLSQPFTEDIYKVLKSTLHKDLQKWNATLDSKNLIVSFHSPQMLFQRGQSELSLAYKTALADFLPKYIKTLQPYEGKIKILIQGHTSSLFDSTEDKKIRFMKNEILSQMRAKNVYEYMKSLHSNAIDQSKSFIQNDVKVIAKSSLETIKNPDMSENHAFSRRVDFKVEVLDESAKPHFFKAITKAESRLVQ